MRRAIAGLEDAKITASLQIHEELMNSYLMKGMDRQSASKTAYADLSLVSDVVLERARAILNRRQHSRNRRAQ